MIVLIEKPQLPECLDVIHRSFATVAEDFGFTETNCPGHTSYMKLENYKISMTGASRCLGYMNINN